MFQALGEWADRRRTLRELRQAQERDSRAHSHIFIEQIKLAKEAVDQGAEGDALEIWGKMRARFPDLSVTSEKAFDLVLDLGRFNEAESLLQEARKRHSVKADLLAARSARAAQRRGDLSEAIRRCDTLRRKFSRVAEGYTIAATCLMELGRDEEAGAIIGRGVMKLPYDLELHVRYARHSMHRREWSEARTRWDIVWTRFGQAVGLLGAAQCLRETGQFSEAEKVLMQASVCFDMNVYTYVELAALANAKGNIDEELKWWGVVLRRFPSFALAYTKSADLMRQIGRDGDSDEVLRVAATRFQSDLLINLEYARSAHRRADWGQAKERWAVVCKLFPTCDEAWHQEQEARRAWERQEAFSPS